jgi:hypothetical protein
LDLFLSVEFCQRKIFGFYPIDLVSITFFVSDKNTFLHSISSRTLQTKEVKKLFRHERKAQKHLSLSKVKTKGRLFFAGHAYGFLVYGTDLLCLLVPITVSTSDEHSDSWKGSYEII